MGLRAQNLGMIITERCNLNCAHCLRGKRTDKVMSDEVIQVTLSQIVGIRALAIYRVEPTQLKFIDQQKIYII